MRPSIRLHAGTRLLACVLVSAAACDGRTPAAADADTVGGSLITAIQAEPRFLLPPLISLIDEQMVGDQIFEPLARMGDDGRLDRDFRPALADSWSWENDSTTIVFRLNPNARWHDGKPVRASDVRFTYDLCVDPVVGWKDREYFARIDSLTVRDSLTVAFWFRSRYPEQFFDAATRMLIVPEHVLASEPRATLQTSSFNRAPIGSGRFRLAKWTPNASIELVADTTHYRGRAKLDRVIFAVTPDANAVTARVASGELDVVAVSSPEHFRTLAARPELKAQILPAFDYTFLLFNTRARNQRSRPHPLFSDLALRRALTMALDRDLLVRGQFDSLAAVAIGPMTRAQALADSTIAGIPHDSSGAARLLDSLGWKLPAGKYVRERGAKPLAFSILVPSISRNRMGIAVRIQEALRPFGVDVSIDAIEPNAFFAKMRAGDFDVAFDGRKADLSVSGLKAYWTVASARQPNGQNFSRYENPIFDAHLDSAVGATDAATAKAHAKQAFSTIIADVPAVWVYEVRTVQMIHKRFRTAHVLPTAWWAGLADWSIPSNERIPRDRLGLKLAAR